MRIKLGCMEVVNAVYEIVSIHLSILNQAAKRPAWKGEAV